VISETADQGLSRQWVFCTAAEMPGQEAFHPAAEIKAILLVVETVSFVVFDDVFDSDPSVLIMQLPSLNRQRDL
jgi:hypothetical protein